MNLKTLILVLKTNTPVTESPEKLRGFIGNKFPDYPLIHHHIKGAEYIYSYPRVQYKVVSGTSMILGIEEGAAIVKEISDDIDELTLGKQTYKVEEKQIFERMQEFGKVKGYRQYRFLTPWLALNEENYRRYKNMDGKNQIMLLHNIMVGNILSIAKAFDYVVLSKLMVKTNVKPTKVQSKGIPLIGFTGEFQANFNLPDLIGIGRSVSRGFGAIKYA